MLSACLRDAGILSADTRTPEGKERFLIHPRPFERRSNERCCADEVVLFHQYKTDEMRKWFFRMHAEQQEDNQGPSSTI